MYHKAPCSSRDYSGVQESGPRKRDEDGDVDEDDHRDDDSPPDGTPAPLRERRRGSPPCASFSMDFPLWSLAFMAMMAPPRSSSMASSDDGPLWQVAREGLDLFLVATKGCGGGTSDLGFFLEVWVYIEEFCVDFTPGGVSGLSTRQGGAP